MNENQKNWTRETQNLEGIWQMSEEAIALGNQQIDAALTQHRRTADDELRLDLRSRLYRSRADGDFFLWFKTPDATGSALAPLKEAISLLLSDESPEASIIKQQRLEEAARRTQQNEQWRIQRLQSERDTRIAQARDAMNERLKKWNDVPRFEQACRLLSVVAPQYGEVAEALIVALAIQEWIPEKWVTPPPCDVDLITKTPMVKEWAASFDETPAPGRAFLKCNSAGFSTPNGAFVHRGEVVDVALATLKNPGIEAFIAGGAATVVESAQFVLRDAE